MVARMTVDSVLQDMAAALIIGFSSALLITVYSAGDIIFYRLPQTGTCNFKNWDYHYANLHVIAACTVVWPLLHISNRLSKIQYTSGEENI